MNSIKDKIGNNFYNVKTTNIKIQDIDDGSRRVKGYFSSFNTLDSDLDVIKKGAFSKSIKEHGVESTSNRKIAHLRNHDWDHQIGKLEELWEDNYGLGFVSKLGRSTKGNDALLDYQDGIIREHSIGFNYIEDKIKFIEDSTLNKDGHFEINEVKLWEGSAVTFGSNLLTPVIEVAKSTKDISSIIDKISSLSDSFIKALKNGKGSDDRLENLELRFKQIQQIQKSLNDLLNPSIKDNLKEKKEPINDNQLLDLIINKLTN